MSSFDNFRNNIKTLVSLEKTSLSEIAKKSGLSRSLVYNYVEGNNSPSIDQIDKIAAALGLKVSALIGEEVPPQVKLAADPIDAQKLEAISLLLKASPGKIDNCIHILKGASAVKKAKASPA